MKQSQKKNRKKFHMHAVGVDIESVDRFSHLKRVTHQRILRRIFTQQEIAYCYSKIFHGEHLAVRYAAKEAVFKALSSLELSPPSFINVEICKRKNGTPFIKFSKKYFSDISISLSLSHTKEYAIAFVYVEYIHSL